MLGKPELIAAIRAEIAQAGPIPFARFMEQALYHPQYGYYAVPSSPHVGRRGDFYTSVSVSGLFGQLLAQQFEQMWELLGRPPIFYFLEQGANDGRFAVDVMRWLKEWRAPCFAALRYRFIEPFAAMRDTQWRTLRDAGFTDKAAWIHDLSEVAPHSLHGIFFSNELVDSFPVHRIVYHGQEWQESYVDWQGEDFGWSLQPIINPELAAAIAARPLHRVPRYTTEVSLQGERWMRHVGSIFETGFVLTVDYGYLDEIYYNPKRIDGTLCCYQQHRRIYDPLQAVGEQDITAHVDFTSLQRAGEAVGLHTIGYTDQHHFMMGLAHDDLASFEERGLHLDPLYAETARAFRTLMHPELMGSTFKFLVQAKGIDLRQPLEGLKFARPLAKG